jgi:hypothetical protein
MAGGESSGGPPQSYRPVRSLGSRLEAKLAKTRNHSAIGTTYPGAVSQRGGRKALWIEVRDSKTGDRKVSLYAAPPPRTRAEREQFLNRYVPMIFPGARLRTYAGGAATFVAGHLLISAHYGAVRDGARILPIEEQLPEPVADRPGQQGSLFAA